MTAPGFAAEARRGIRISALQLGEADALLSGPTWGDFATAVGVADEAAPAAAPTPPPLPPVEEPEEQPGARPSARISRFVSPERLGYVWGWGASSGRV